MASIINSEGRLYQQVLRAREMGDPFIAQWDGSAPKGARGQPSTQKKIATAVAMTRV